MGCCQPGVGNENGRRWRDQGNGTLCQVRAGLIIAIILAIFAGWSAIVIDALLGKVWPLEVQRNQYLVAIGIGSGTGAYFAWVNLALPRHLITASIVDVLLGAIARTYVGYAYGQGVETTYMDEPTPSTTPSISAPLSAAYRFPQPSACRGKFGVA